MKTIILSICFVLMFWEVSFSAAPPKPKETKESPASVETKPVDTKPSEIKPEEPKPAEEKSKQVKRIEKYIAIFDFEHSGKFDKDVIRTLTESIRREVVKSGKWEVIDRGNMDKILGEQKFQLSGCVSGQCIVEVGQLLGVGKIITGSISMVGKTYYLSLQLVNVETGKIEDQSEDECKCEIDDLIRSSKRLVKKLMGEVVTEPTIASETKQSQQPPSTPFSKGEYTDTSGIEMVYIKGGCFQMGDTFGDGDADQKPVHEVCLDDFYIGKYEVTQGQWKAIMGNNPSSFSSCGDNCPVENVSWNDIQDFINKLNSKTGNNYKLPTEAEWEYAARSGGKNEKYSGGNDIESVAWYTSNSGSKTHPVGTKTANGLGIYDMSGNVWEWVNDWHGDKYYSESPKNNPKGPNSGSYRVLRGGCWFGDAGDSRAAFRGGGPGDRSSYSGFRLVRTR